MSSNSSKLRRIMRYLRTNRTAVAVFTIWSVGAGAFLIGELKLPKEHLLQWMQPIGVLTTSLAIVLGIEFRLFRPLHRSQRTVITNIKQIGNTITKLKIINDTSYADTAKEKTALISNAHPDLNLEKPREPVYIGRIPSVQPEKLGDQRAGRAAANFKPLTVSDEYLQLLLTSTDNPIKPKIDLVAKLSIIDQLSNISDTHSILPGMNTINTRRNIDYFVIFSSSFESGAWQYAMKTTHYSLFNQLFSTLIALRKTSTVTIYVEDQPITDHFTSTIKEFSDIILRNGNDIKKTQNTFYKVALIDTLAQYTQKEFIA